MTEINDFRVLIKNWMKYYEHCGILFCLSLGVIAKLDKRVNSQFTYKFVICMAISLHLTYYWVHWTI